MVAATSNEEMKRTREATMTIPDDDGFGKELKRRKRKRNQKKKNSGGGGGGDYDADGTTSANVDPSSSDAASSAKRRAELLSLALFEVHLIPPLKNKSLNAAIVP